MSKKKNNKYSKIKTKSKGSICYKLYFKKQSKVEIFPYTFFSCEEGSIRVSSPIDKNIKQRSPDFSCNEHFCYV